MIETNFDDLFPLTFLTIRKKNVLASDKICIEMIWNNKYLRKMKIVFEKKWKVLFLKTLVFATFGVFLSNILRTSPIFSLLLFITGIDRYVQREKKRERETEREREREREQESQRERERERGERA